MGLRAVLVSLASALSSVVSPLLVSGKESAACTVCHLGRAQKAQESQSNRGSALHVI
jgi:hypothetical protein